MTVEHVCPAGLVCRPGRTAAPNLVDDACPAGFYCVAGDEVTPVLDIPEPCPTGTYLPFKGAKSILECRPCPEGTFFSLSSFLGIYWP